MTVYLNKTPRPDILVETGGSLDENEAHVTSSTLRIYILSRFKRYRRLRLYSVG